MRSCMLITLCAVAIALGNVTANATIPTSITVQGKLTDASGVPLSAGAKSFTFRIFNAATLGTQIWPAAGGELQSLTSSTEGLWIGLVGAVSPLTDLVFTDSVRWLEISVSGTTLPRVRLVTGPYAYRVATIDGASGGTISTKVSIGSGHTNTGISAFVAGENNRGHGDYSTVSGGGGPVLSDSNAAIGDWSTVGGGQGNSAVNRAATVAGGEKNLALGGAASIGGGENNSTTANFSTVAGGELNRATSLYATVGGGLSNRAHGANSVIAGGGGPTIADSNSATGARSAIGGGRSNVASGEGAFIGGGALNTAGGILATVAGGLNNVSSGTSAAIAGGELNRATGLRAFVGGGMRNMARGDYSVVSGGGGNLGQDSNAAVGDYSTVPGGRANVAGGDYGFAAGHRAKALHVGAFVWADSGNIDFASTAQDQFLIRASGGVGIGTNSPEAPIHISEGSAGATTAHNNAIATFERNDNAYVQIFTPDANESGLLLGTPAASIGGAVLFNSGAVPNGLEFRTNTNDFAVAITASGNMGIGTTTIPNILTLPNVASVAGRGLANAWSVYSSRRWKTDIHTINDPLGKVERLRGVTYRPKEGGAEQIGLIAEEVGEVLPEIVQYEENGVDAQSLDYSRLVAVLIEAVKEQQKRIEALESKLEQSTP